MLSRPARLTTLAILGGAVLCAVAMGRVAAGAAEPVRSPAAAAAPRLASAPAQPATAGARSAFDGVVEAVRQTAVAAQVPGAVVALEVRVGDRVVAGQALARLDARAAEQSALASEAQVRAVQASLEVARKTLDRQRQLRAQQFISQAALDQAEAEFHATEAQAQAQLAQARAARAQSGFYVVRAPYAGVVSEVPVQLGDMAMPGRPLVTIYDPASLRVTASLSQSVAAAAGEAPVTIELPTLPEAARRVTPVRRQTLPAADARTHTVEVRFDLPPALAGVAPGQFARVWLVAPADDAAGARVLVPASALVRRAELDGVYVMSPEGRPLLRWVRVGPRLGDRVELLSGVSPGEVVASDAQVASRLR